jgi:hypothetical protein
MKKADLIRTGFGVFLLGLLGQAQAGISVDFKPYGYIKADMSWDQQTTNDGNYVMYVKPFTGSKSEQFNMTAKETRLGFWIENKDHSDFTVKGRVEVDGYGSESTENKGHLMLRHIYVEVACPLGTLLAGQTSDVISPLVATTLNYSVGWGIGNIGYRRPQLRLATTLAKSLSIDLAAVRPIGDDLSVQISTVTDSIDDGKASGSPHYQGRLGFSGSFLKIGVSGHYGRLKARNSTNTAHENYETKSINGDIQIPFKKLLVKGEYFKGENLKTYLGSILNNDTIAGVRSHGGWVDATYALTSSFKVVAGMGKERVNENDIAANARDANRFAFGNFQFTARHGVMYGVEVSQYKTDYKDAPDALSNRVQASCKYSF